MKGVSKIGGGINIVSDSVMDNVGKIFRTNGNQQHRMNIKLNKETNTFSIVEDNQAEVMNFSFYSNDDPSVLIRMQRIFHFGFYWLLWMKCSI